MFEPITVPRKVRPDKLKQTCPFTEELSEYSVKAGREYLSKLRCYLEERFKDGYAVAELLSCRTYVIDKLLSGLYHHFNLTAFDNFALAAVGGYGRGELFPLSDIDILIVGDYDKLLAVLNDLFKQREKLLNIGDLFIRDKDGSIVDNGFHLFGVGDHVYLRHRERKLYSEAI